MGHANECVRIDRAHLGASSCIQSQFHHGTRQGNRRSWNLKHIVTSHDISRSVADILTWIRAMNDTSQHGDDQIVEAFRNLDDKFSELHQQSAIQEMAGNGKKAALIKDVQRLRQLDEILRGQGVNVVTLATAWRVTTRTVYRYMDVLRELVGPTESTRYNVHFLHRYQGTPARFFVKDV